MAMRSATLFLLLLLVAPLPDGRAESAAGNTETTRLTELIDSQWQRYLREHPHTASEQGDLRYNDRWPDLSPGAMRASHQADVAALKELETIDAERLTDSDRVNYDLFRRRRQNRRDIVAAGSAAAAPRA